MPEERQSSIAELSGRLLPAQLRELMFEPYHQELWRTCVAEGCSLRSRCRFMVQAAGGFGVALFYSTPYYLRGPRGATRICGIPVVFLAAMSLGLTIVIRDCAYIGLALTLVR